MWLALAGFLALGITLIGALIFGRKWWAPFSLIASGVLLALQLAPDAYFAFVIFDALFIFDGLFATALTIALWSRRHGVAHQLRPAPRPS